MRAIFIIFLFAFSGFFSWVSAQAVNEPVQNSIYEFLYRNAQKGNIELDDVVRPLLRNQISRYLDSIEKRAVRVPGSLNRIEKKELQFYKREYGGPIQEGIRNLEPERWLSKDPRGDRKSVV